MDTIKIPVADYYGNPSYYSVMPEAIFDALELASLRNEDWAVVDLAQYNKMVEDYKIKMQDA